MTLFGYICIMDMVTNVTYTITQALNDNQYVAVNDKSDRVLVYPSLVKAIDDIEKIIEKNAKK